MSTSLRSRLSVVVPLVTPAEKGEFGFTKCNARTFCPAIGVMDERTLYQPVGHAEVCPALFAAPGERTRISVPRPLDRGQRRDERGVGRGARTWLQIGHWPLATSHWIGARGGVSGAVESGQWPASPNSSFVPYHLSPNPAPRPKTQDPRTPPLKLSRFQHVLRHFQRILSHFQRVLSRLQRQFATVFHPGYPFRHVRLLA